MEISNPNITSEHFSPAQRRGFGRRMARLVTHQPMSADSLLIRRSI
jgi:hypothetical protein